jgi:hypothetical protein
VLVAMNPVRDLLMLIETESWGWGPGGTLARAVVLPSVTWGILVAMAMIWLAAQLDQRGRTPARVPS